MSPDAKSDDPATHVRGSEGRRLWLVESATLPTLDGEEAQEALLKLFLGDEPSSKYQFEVRCDPHKNGSRK